MRSVRVEGVARTSYVETALSGGPRLSLTPGVQGVVNRQLSGQLRVIVVEDFAEALGDGHQSWGFGGQVGPVRIGAAHDPRQPFKRRVVSCKLVLTYDG